MADYEVGGIATVKAKITGVFDDAGRIELTVGDDIFGIHQSHIFSYKPPSLAQRLAGLTVEQIEAALAYGDKTLAGAFEDAGALALQARKDARDFRRRPKNTRTGEVGATPSPQATSETHPVGAGDDTGAAEHTAKMAAKQGRGSLDKYLAALDDDGREDARSFMPELLGIADAADDDAKDAKAANERAREVDDLPM